MNLNIEYSTKERKYLNPCAYQNVSKEASLPAVRIIRRPCGSHGAAKSRFYYQAEFVAPEDAEFVHSGEIRENIVRKKNPHFKPKDFKFVGNVAEVFYI